MANEKVYAAFVKAQQCFAPALKSSVNHHFKSRYVDLAGCVEAVIDALNANGIGLIQRTFADTSGVTVETVFIHESGESIECGKLHVPASKNDAQGYGSALTYGRRYSLMAACGIAPEDDDGNVAAKPYTPPAPKQRNFAKEKASIENSATLPDLKTAWMALDKEAQSVLSEIKDAQKAKIDAAGRAE